MATGFICRGGGGGVGGGILIQSTTPTSAQVSQGYKLWVNTSNSTLLYWNGSAWKQVIGVWG